MIAFIDDYREIYGVEPICRVMPIAPSTYHRVKAQQADPACQSARAQRDAVLREAIDAVWQDNRCVYGARKVRRPLQRDRWAVARCTVERLMQEMGLRGATRGNHRGPRSPIPTKRHRTITSGENSRRTRRIGSRSPS